MGDETAQRPRTRSESKAATRERVLASAALTFARMGYAGASMTEIAHGAGVAVGSVYTHFPTKQELFQEALVGRFSEELSDVDEQSGRSSDDLLALYQERLRSSSESEDAGALQAEMWLFAMRDERFRAAVAAQQHRVVDSVRQATGRIREPVARDWALTDAEYAVVMVALFRGLVQMRRLNPDLVDPALLGKVGRIASGAGRA